MKFGCILADPPWQFHAWARDATATSRLAEAYYETQNVDWIRSLPIQGVAARDCVLFLWATCPTLPEAFSVIHKWGFTYKTVAFSWIKTNKDGSPKMGMGYWTRANVELCLLATRGHPKRLNADVRQVIMSPLRAHSQKPDEQYARIERLINGPYLEMFARPHDWMPTGWTQIGNEITGRSIECDLELLSREKAL